MRRAVAESLALRRSQGEDGADQIEEETVDDTKQVANDGCTKSQILPVFTYDLDADHALAKRRSSPTFADDVVAEPEQEEHPEGLPLDVDPGVRVAVAGLGVAAACQQAEDDPCREEDDEAVEELVETATAAVEAFPE